jgi:hypothetical protein
MLLASENPKVVQERLGHASIGITLDTYSHMLPSVQTGPAAKLDGIIKAGWRKTTRMALNRQQRWGDNGVPAAESSGKSGVFGG